MTEAMSRREIEDVLSSIRRIVTHEVNPAVPSEGLGDKLLLTSELRVDDGAPAPVGSDMATTDVQTPMPASLLARISTATQPVSARQNTAPHSQQEPVLSAQLPDFAEMSGQASIEDSALEATLARLESVLANSVKPDTTDNQSRETAATDEEIIDEGVLHQIVSQIVRQELQGELGEKITRNIRKLVRAEVARELQMRKL